MVMGMLLDWTSINTAKKTQYLTTINIMDLKSYMEKAGTA
jgi:hypothetical protein